MAAIFVIDSWSADVSYILKFGDLKKVHKSQQKSMCGFTIQPSQSQQPDYLEGQPN